MNTQQAGDPGRDTPVDKTRVLGVFAHIDAGKTTTSEAILYHTGRIHRLGRVDDGDTQLDWMKQERQRGITVTSAATTCYWHGRRINLIDTPGHIDFSAEVVRSIRVIDGAVMVLCGVGGVEPQTEAVWSHADRERLPRVIFVNKLDRRGADFGRVLEDIRAALTPNAVALQIPIGREAEFTGVVGLISRRALTWERGAEEPAVGPVPEALEAEVALARSGLVDAICETDEALLQERLAGREPEPATLQAAARRATIAGKLVPVLCGSALHRVGIEPLLDAIVLCLPSPLEAPAARPAGGEGAFCAGAFKIVTDPHVGHLTWVRVFAGRRQTGQAVLNPRTGAEERVTRIYQMHANRRAQVDHMATGDVVALVGVRSAVTGDTLCDPAHPVSVSATEFPDPVIMVALAPGREAERQKLRRAVRRLCREDPTLVARFEPETGEEVLSGMGELHLEVAVDRLRTEFGVDPRVSPPLVAFRETARRPAEAAGTYRKQSGGHGHFARVRLRVEPLARGAGVVFENATTPPGGPPGRRRGWREGVPAEFVRHVELGVREMLEKGVAAGYPVTDVRVTLIGGRFHEIDSSQLDFHIAGSMAARQAVRRAHPGLIEPVMRADLSVGQGQVGAVTGDLGRRRGMVRSIEARGERCRLAAEVPLAEARGYATDLRSLTGGRCHFELRLLRYDLVPDDVAEGIIARRRAAGRIPER